MIFKNKKGDVGGTITWMVAFIIIFLIMVFFIVATIGMAAIRELPVVSWFVGIDKGSILAGFNPEESMTAQRNMLAFLERQASFKGGAVQIEELAVNGGLGTQKERADAFKSSAQGFINEFFPVGFRGRYSSVWVRAYDSGEDISWVPSRKNPGFEASNSVYAVDPVLRYCQPGWEKSFLSQIFISQNKQMVLCVTTT